MRRPRLDRSPLLAIAAAALVALSACSRSSATPTTPAAQATPAKAVAVNAAPVKRVDIVSTLNYTGDVKARATLNVVPKVTGRIEKLLVDLGQSVKQGDVIAELEKDQQTLQVRQAEAALAAAQQRLALVKAGPRPEAVAQAEANARAAHAKVASLQQAAKPEVIAQAKANLDAAQQRLESLKNPRPEAIAQADDNLKAAQAKLDALKKGATPEQIRAAEIAVEQAKNNLYAVQTQKDGACVTGGVQCSTAVEQAQAAEQAVKAAEQQLTILKAPPTAEQLAQAQAAVDQAKAAADLARQPASDQDIAQAQNAVTAAQAALSLAQNPVLPSDVEAAQAQADAADAAARLAANPYTQQDIDAAQAQVDQAQAQLDLARTQLQELAVKSPVTGVVADKFLVVGSVASPTTPIISVAASDTEIDFNVEESQLGRLQPGEPAKISVPALPGEAISGKVALVAPTVDPKSRTGQVRVVPDPDQMGKLKPGMFAQVSVETEKKQNALVVPRSAILPGSPPQVFVVDNGQVRKVGVQTGVQDRDQVEITQGLKDGDQVVLDAVDLREGDRVQVASLK
jgi:multidrug efflux pump subunit AcrA (membrane-fusion protein)